MEIIKVTRELRFEAAHLLEDHKGKCRNIHGHSYKCHVSVSGRVDKDGMVLDFSTLSNICEKVIEPMDHSLIISSAVHAKIGAPLMSIYEALGMERLIVVPYTPTAENMAVSFRKLITAILIALNYEFTQVTIKLYETEKSYVETT